MQPLNGSRALRRGIELTHASIVHPRSRGMGDDHGWAGEFFWRGGHVVITNRYNRHSCCDRHFRSRSFGWRLTCAASSCRRPATLDVGGIELLATERRRPAIAAAGGANLWLHAGRWVRGIWPVKFRADDPSGVCRMGVGLGTYFLPGPLDRRNTDRWRQCPERSWSALINTASAHGRNGARQGAMTLRISAINAARVRAIRSESVYVDNTRPWVKITGPRRCALHSGNPVCEGKGRRQPIRDRWDRMPCRPPCCALVPRFLGAHPRVRGRDSHDRVCRPESGGRPHRPPRHLSASHLEAENPTADEYYGCL